MVYSSAQPFSSSTASYSHSAAASSGGAVAVPPSRPSTPVVGPQSFGGTHGSSSSAAGSLLLSSAKARLAALTVALPTLAEAEEPGSAVGNGEFVFAPQHHSQQPGSPSLLARSTTEAIGGTALLTAGRTAPAPSPAAAMLAGGGEVGHAHSDVFGSGSFGSAAPSFGAAAGVSVTHALSSSRPSSPLLFGSRAGGSGSLVSGSGAGVVASLVLPHLNREDAAAPATFGGGVVNGVIIGGEGEEGGSSYAAHAPSAVPVPAVVTVTSAGVVTESKVAADAGSVVVAAEQPFVLSANAFNPFAGRVNAAPDVSAADALDTIAAQDAARDASVAASFGAAPSSQRPSPFGTPAVGSAVAPFGSAVAGGFVSNDAPQQQQQWTQASPQRPYQLPPWQPQAPQQHQQQRGGPTPQQALMLQRFAAQQAQARAALALRQQQHQQQQQQAAVARLLFTQQQQQQRMAPVPRASAAPQAAAVDDALVPACNGRCRPPLAPRNGGLNVLALTRAGSIACAYCGQRAYSKVATVDTDPYALSGNGVGSAGSSGGGGRTPTIPSLSSPPRAPTSFGGAASVAASAMPSSGPVSSHRPVSSYGAVRRAPRHSKPHHRRTASSSSSSSSSGLSPETAAGADENDAVVVGVPQMARNPNYNPYLSDDLNAASSCFGVGEGVTYASLKSRRNARRGSNGSGSSSGGGFGGPSILPRARVVLSNRSSATAGPAGGRA